MGLSGSYPLAARERNLKVPQYTKISQCQVSCLTIMFPSGRLLDMIIHDLNTIGLIGTQEQPYSPPEPSVTELLIPDTAFAPWPPRLAFDLALGDTPEEAALHYNLTAEEMQRIMQNPIFRKEVSEHLRDIRENGVSFRHKARVLAESYLEDVNNIVEDTEVGVTVRMDAIKHMVKWADLEPKPSKELPNQPQFNIQFNL